MTPLRIAFTQNVAARRTALLGLLASMLLLGFVGMEAYRAKLALDDAEFGLRRAQDPRLSTAPIRKLEISEKKTDAINAAIKALNADWENWLTAFDSDQYQNVALLSLHPAGSEKTLLLSAEAKSVEEMVSFTKMLQDSALIDSVLIKHQEVNLKDGNLPIRFVLGLRWK